MRPHVYIGMINHGKTSLMAAITATLAEKGFTVGEAKEGEPLVIVGPPPERGITIETSHVEYEPPSSPAEFYEAHVSPKSVFTSSSPVLIGRKVWRGTSQRQRRKDRRRAKAAGVR